VKLDQTRDYVRAIRHDLATGRHEQARSKLGELVNWPGDPQKATTAQVQHALSDIETQMRELGL
jgi:hypothetical protein